MGLGGWRVPLGVLPPNLPLDWEMDRVEDKDPSLAIMDAFEEDFLREVKVVRPKTKGKKEILNLVSSIIMVMQARPLGIGKARFTCCRRGIWILNLKWRGFSPFSVKVRVWLSFHIP
jgi:hypothetical protein